MEEARSRHQATGGAQAGAAARKSAGTVGTAFRNGGLLQNQASQQRLSARLSGRRLSPHHSDRRSGKARRRKRRCLFYRDAPPEPRRMNARMTFTILALA